jgi:tight adherence protein C
LREPFATRVLVPAAGALVELARRFVPSEYVEKCRQKLIMAGKNQPEDLDRYLIVRIFAIIAVPVLWIVVWKLTHLKGTELLAVIVLVGMAGALGPDASLNRMVAERQNQIRNKLPDVLDLLTISVEAGLGFDQALNRTVTMVPGPLAEEFNRMLGEMRAGASRADALTALDERTQVPELRSFILALLQADTFGVSVGAILRTQAVEMRVKRRQRAQEQAQKAPVKMLFPMVFCIMPALFVVIAGPAVIGIYHAFHH